MAVHNSDATREEVTIGLVGADEFVQKAAELARSSSYPGLRLVPAVYRREDQAAEAASKITDRVDAILFAGPLPYDIAMKAGDLTVPATYVPTGGPALHSTLVRGIRSGVLDPQRVSIDSMGERDVLDSYAEIEIDPKDVHYVRYDESITPEGYLKFHLDLFRSGKTSGAISTIPTVMAGLAAENVPALKMSPSPLTLRQALNTAVLTASGAKFSESRIAIVLVQLADSALPPRTSPAQYWYQDLRLTLHRELLHDARRMDAIVLPHDQRSYMVITTLGMLRPVTDDLAVAPFLARASASLNVDLEVGIGLGRSTVEAENNAYRAVSKASAEGSRQAYLIGPDELTLRLPASPDGDTDPTPQRPTESKDQALLRTLVDKLGEEESESLVIDAERVAQLLQVTLRTARRTLQGLVRAGLAWPMPPSRSRKVGRPPMQYQLLGERLETTTSAPNNVPKSDNNAPK